MTAPAIVHHTFVLERTFPKPVERVYAAFADPAKKRRWFADGHTQTVESFEMDFRVGGKETARYRLGDNTPFPGVPMVHDGYFLNIVPNKRIVSGSTMTVGEHCISASQGSFEFLPSGTGAKLVFTHQGAFFENSDGPKMREDGWVQILAKLTKELA
jgi:uncharacterized protein YndB with AHSA1/START domain